MISPFGFPFRRFNFSGLGALGGARGPNPYPSQPTVRFPGGRGRKFHPEPVTHRLEVNHSPQPWQKHAAKLAERAKEHAHPLARRQAREGRKALEAVSLA